MQPSVNLRVELIDSADFLQNLFLIQLLKTSFNGFIFFPFPHFVFFLQIVSSAYIFLIIWICFLFATQVSLSGFHFLLWLDGLRLPKRSASNPSVVLWNSFSLGVGKQTLVVGFIHKVLLVFVSPNEFCCRRSARSDFSGISGIIDFTLIIIFFFVAGKPWTSGNILGEGRRLPHAPLIIFIEAVGVGVNRFPNVAIHQINVKITESNNFVPKLHLHHNLLYCSVLKN